MHEDLINQIQHLKQRIEDERELSFTHLDMVHNVLPILRNMELVLTKGNVVNFDNLVEDAEKHGALVIRDFNDEIGVDQVRINAHELKGLITQYILADRAASGEAVGTVTITNGGLYQDTSIKRGLADGKHALFLRAQPTPAQIAGIQAQALEYAADEILKMIDYDGAAAYLQDTAKELRKGEPL